MLRYVQNIFSPYFSRQGKLLGVDAHVPGLVEMGVFRAHRTSQVLKALEAANMKYVFVPANCTSELQVMDLVVNKVVKDKMKAKFTEWHSKQVLDIMAL